MTAVITRQIPSASIGAHQIPSPPNTAVRTTSAPTIAIMLRVSEIAVANPAFSTDVKYPPITTLSPASKKDAVNILNTRIELIASSDPISSFHP